MLIYPSVQNQRIFSVPSHLIMKSSMYSQFRSLTWWCILCSRLLKCFTSKFLTVARVAMYLSSNNCTSSANYFNLYFFIFLPSTFSICWLLSVHLLHQAGLVSGEYLHVCDKDLLRKITDNESQGALTPATALSVHRPSQSHRYTLLARPVVIQMLGWWLSRLSLLIGACKGITALGERRHANFDMENHICKPQNNIIYRELNIPGKTFPANLSICFLGLTPCLFPFFRSSKSQKAGEGERGFEKWDK